jgi:hypothetical protein
MGSDRIAVMGLSIKRPACGEARVTVICLATVPTVDPVMNEGLPAQLTNNRYK